MSSPGFVGGALDTKCLPLDLSAGYRIAAFFAKHAAISAKRATIQQMRRIFTAKSATIQRLLVLYKTAHCGTAVKVRRTRWEKSDAHGTVFSSAAAACVLHSF